MVRGIRHIATMARGKHFAVAAGHPAAVSVARSVYEQGGTVADAAIAASAMLCVVLPQATSLGGDLLGLYHDAGTGIVHGLDAAGVAPARATAQEFARGMPRKGIRSAVIPGIVAGWQMLHDRFGSRPWKSLLDPAAQCASEGVEPSSGMREFLVECREDLVTDTGCNVLFPASVGDAQLFRQRALGATLDRLGEFGAADFYRGTTAEALVHFMAREGGLWTSDDLAGYRPRWIEAMRGGYRGHEICVLPPPSFGLLLLLQLAGLETLDPALLRDPVRCFDAQRQAMGHAFTLGERYLHGAGPAMKPSALATLRASMCEAMHGASQAPCEIAGGTACVVIGDVQGNVAVLVQSVFQPFGAACADTQTGILLNNRLSGFNAIAGDPNCVAPGKRPRHTLCPALTLEHGRPRWAVASPGGLSQTVTLTQVLSHLIDGGCSPAESVALPRWSLGRQREVLIEPAFAPLPLDLLQREGIVVRDDPYSFGSAKVVAWGNGGGALIASADGRRDAGASAY